MSEVKWIKIVTDIFDDEKILLIESLPEADSLIVIWFKILCLAGKQNNSGVFVMANGIPYTEPMLATIFRRKESTVKLALKTFEQFGMVEIVNGALTIPNWGKHQSLDAYENKKERDRLYQAERRSKQLQIAESSDKSSDVASLEEDIDKIEIRIDKKKSTEKARPRFSVPSLDEVKAYCLERGNNVDAEYFIDFYASKGWKVGRDSMKDWKAALRRSEKWDSFKGGGQAGLRGTDAGTSEAGSGTWNGYKLDY